MGKQHAGKRKHFYLHLAACLVPLMGAQACAHLSSTTWEGREQLNRAHVLWSQGEFESSLATCKEVLAKSYSPLGDRALYQIAVVYADPRNPTANIQESIRSFQTIVSEFPDSEVRADAELWALTLTKFLEMEREVQSLRASLTLSEKAIQESRSVNKATLQELTRAEASNVRLKEQAKELQARIDQLQAQMDSLKKIDLTIEKKKRERNSR